MPTTVKPAQLRKVTPLMTMEFTTQNIKKTANCAEGLAEWVLAAFQASGGQFSSFDKRQSSVGAP